MVQITRVYCVTQFLIFTDKTSSWLLYFYCWTRFNFLCRLICFKSSVEIFWYIPTLTVLSLHSLLAVTAPLYCSENCLIYIWVGIHAVVWPNGILDNEITDIMVKISLQFSKITHAGPPLLMIFAFDSKLLHSSVAIAFRSCITSLPCLYYCLLQFIPSRTYSCNLLKSTYIPSHTSL